MIIEGHAMERHPVQAAVPQRSAVSPILFAIYTSGLIKWVEEYISAKRIDFLRLSRLSGDWKRCQTDRHDTRVMRSKEYRMGK
jgi:hypothetical protein